MKKIVIAKHCGFCSGVKRCVSFAEEALKYDDNVYALGELLHNETEMTRLKNLGMKVVNNIEELPNNVKLTLIIRTHGVDIHTYSKLQDLSDIKIIDGTCPIVKRNQSIVSAWSKKGYDVVVYGDINHPEIKALVSYVNPNSKCYIINSQRDLQTIGISQQKNIILLAQTTKPVDEYKGICETLLSKNKKIKVFNTICKETILREKEVYELSQKVDFVIIIGGKNSANTKKLFSIAQINNKNVVVVNSVSELENINFENCNSVGICSGASTPKWLVDNIVDKLKDVEVTVK